MFLCILFLCFFFFFFFFFSSRRRHTRYIGDWSSDVCSSDLRDHAWSVSSYGPTSTWIGGATTGGTLWSGGVPTITVSSRTSLPAFSLMNAMPCVPVTIVTVATCEPAATITLPAIVATAGSLLVTVTGVFCAAGVGSTGTVRVCCPPSGTISIPAEGADCTTIPAGGATIGGTRPAGGAPTITVSSRTVAPTRNVRNATPFTPVATISGATCDPAGTTTGPTTLATAGSLLVTVTGVLWLAGASSSGIVSEDWPVPGAMSCPAEAGVSTTRPTGAARIGGVLPGVGVPTTTVRPRTSVPARSVISAVPRAPVAIVSVAVREPAGTITEPTTCATLASLLVACTAVSWLAG